MKMSIKGLEKKLRRYLYPLIKKRDGDICMSCGRKGLKGANLHAGHFIKAEVCNLKYRYDERNIHSQCYYCNKWLAGNTIAYRFAMLKKYGEKVVDELESNYKKPLPEDFNSREFLEDRISHYKSLAELPTNTPVRSPEPI